MMTDVERLGARGPGWTMEAKGGTGDDSYFSPFLRQAGRENSLSHARLLSCKFIQTTLFNPIELPTCRSFE